MTLLHRVRRLGAQMGGGVRQHASVLLLAALAAGISYLLAGALFGTQQAVFAPIAAVVATGLSAGQRRGRAVEISAGVVLGIASADLLSRWLGIGAWQLALAVLVAMTTAVAFRPSSLMANQAAVAAVVVMTLAQHLGSDPWVRLGDAVVGAAVALLLTSLVGADPFRAAVAEAEAILSRYSHILERLGQEIAGRSLPGAEEALEDMASLVSARQDIADAVAAARERISLARSRTRAVQRRRLHAVEQLGARMDLLLSSGRAMCRAGANLVRHPRQVAPALPHAVDQLARAVDELRSWIGSRTNASQVRQKALTAAVTASAVYSDPYSPTTSVLVGQIRSTVVDLLRITGLSQDEAVAALEDAAGRADRSGPGGSQ
ncbi:FUSC family protein [Leucobacter sp. CSA1]|uniref:FUSC family protein n=1 Tax=Leucobacter chromiisoli TaxID=2796471 RepID=A0A934Q5K4_9MICO|nr:FUSC family protein [Leucobacter chromiisoli]MBK0418016.1 FUSC family protein [Leucobacter chromiisoli]